MPNGTQEIDAALFDVARQSGMSRVEVANGAVIVPSEDRNGRVLIPLAVFAPEIVFERIVATTQEPQPVPAARPRVARSDRPRRQWQRRHSEPDDERHPFQLSIQSVHIGHGVVFFFPNIK